jgi:hypothetical protein
MVEKGLISKIGDHEIFPSNSSQIRTTRRQFHIYFIVLDFPAILNDILSRCLHCTKSTYSPITLTPPKVNQLHAVPILCKIMRHGTHPDARTPNPYALLPRNQLRERRHPKHKRTQQQSQSSIHNRVLIAPILHIIMRDAAISCGYGVKGTGKHGRSS